MDDIDEEKALENWLTYKDRLKCQFTVFTTKETELLTLSIKDFSSMRDEFIEAYDELMANGLRRIEKCHKLKLLAIRYCESYLSSKYPTLARDGQGFNAIAVKNLMGISRCGTESMNMVEPFADFKFTAVDLREVDADDFDIDSQLDY